MLVGGIDGDLELSRVAPGLGENEATLNGGQGRRRQFVEIGAPRELAPCLHGREALMDLTLPAIERGVERAADLVVRFSQLADEGADGAASATVAPQLKVNELVEPRPNRPPAVERAKLRLLIREDVLAVVRDHGAKQVLPIGEVVVELALADARRIDHVIEAGLGHAALSDQVGRGGDDALTGLPALHGLRCFDHDRTVAIWTA